MGIFLCLILLFPGVCGLSSSVQRQFHVVKEQKNWTEAQQYCREKFTDLATIDDMAEMERLKRAIHEEHVEEAWIGLKRGSSYKWQWSLADRDFYGENEAEFRNWAINEPQGRDSEDCAAISTRGQWLDHFCGNAPTFAKFPFICNDEKSSTQPYVLVKHKRTWRDAQRYCREKHTDLASVRNQTENDQIAVFTGPANSFVWIGLFRDTWEWSDGSSSSFRHWASGEPNYVDPKLHGLCAEIWPSGQWNDNSCKKLKNFICYEALPTVEVVFPPSPFYSGDEVTLRCDIPKYPDSYPYAWVRDNSTVPGKSSQTITITLPQEAGQYQCGGRREDSSVAPHISRPVKITSNPLPIATVVVVSPFYSGDAVTLNCNITQYTDWYEFGWVKDNSTVPGKSSQTITITLPQEAGQYQCRGQRQGRPDVSSASRSVNIMNNDKLVLVPEDKTWMEALLYCREHHVDLVSVSSEQIQRWVEGCAKGASSPHVWLGLRYSCSLGFWFWVNGDTVCYDNWASDAEREQGCATRVGAVGRDGGQWVSLEETEKLNFICTSDK